MMLLDTHVLVWARTTPDRLGPTIHRRVTAGAAVYFSPVSLVELQIKTMRGKLNVDPAVLSDPSPAGYEELPQRASHAEALARFPAPAGRDPFDRMLLAQAAAEEIDLITADSALLDLGLAWVHDARC